MLGFFESKGSVPPPPSNPLQAQRDYNVHSAEVLLKLLKRGYGDHPKLTKGGGWVNSGLGVLTHHKSALERKKERSGLTENEETNLQLLERGITIVHGGKKMSVIQTYLDKVEFERRTKNPSEQDRLRELTHQEVDVYQEKGGRKFTQYWLDNATEPDTHLRPDVSLEFFQDHREKLGLKLSDFKNKDGKPLTQADLDAINFDETIKWMAQHDKWDEKWLAENHLNFDVDAQLNSWLNNLKTENNDGAPLTFYTLKESAVEHPDHNRSYHENMARGLALDYRDHISGGAEPENLVAPSYLVTENPVTGVVTTYVAFAANEASTSFKEHLKEHGFEPNPITAAQYKSANPKAGPPSVLGATFHPAPNT